MGLISDHLTEVVLNSAPHAGCFADVLAYLNDSPGHRVEDYRPGWHDDLYVPTGEETAWWCGFGVGIDGIDAEPPAEYDAAGRKAWDAGYWSGYDSFVGEIEPDWESMYPDEGYHPIEAIEALGCIEARKG